MRDIEGKTALDIATEKGYAVITQILKDRAEGRKPVCSSSHIAPQTDLVSGNFEHLVKAVNAEVSMNRATQKNENDTARVIKPSVEATLDISNNCSLHTLIENSNF